MIRYRNAQGRFISKDTARSLGRRARSEIVTPKGRTVLSARGYTVQERIIERRADIAGPAIRVYDVEEVQPEIELLPTDLDELRELEEDFPELDLFDDIEELYADDEAWYHGEGAEAAWIEAGRPGRGL